MKAYAQTAIRELEDAPKTGRIWFDDDVSTVRKNHKKIVEDEGFPAEDVSTGREVQKIALDVLSEHS